MNTRKAVRNLVGSSMPKRSATAARNPLNLARVRAPPSGYGEGTGKGTRMANPRMLDVVGGAGALVVALDSGRDVQKLLHASRICCAKQWAHVWPARCVGAIEGHLRLVVHGSLLLKLVSIRVFSRRMADRSLVCSAAEVCCCSNRSSSVLDMLPRRCSVQAGNCGLL
jgi:hypothetical protein